MKENADLNDFLQRARDLGAVEAKAIDANSIVTAAWVRLKCQFGCGGYNSSLCCPPYTPTPEETQAAIDYAVEQTLLRYPPCSCGFTPEEQKQLGHLVGMITDIGRGDTRQGVETMRMGFRLFGRLQWVSEKIGLAIIMAAGSIFVYGVWKGIKIIVRVAQSGGE